jgi:hypothetical protein
LLAVATGTTLRLGGGQRDVEHMGEVSATSSATALMAANRSKTISARELLETYLERIARLDRGGVNAVVPIGRTTAR